MNFGISFAPLVPEAIVWVVLAIACVLGALLVFARARGLWMRIVAMALFVLALANPSITREDRDPLTSVAVVVIDKSPSQEFGDRPFDLVDLFRPDRVCGHRIFHSLDQVLVFLARGEFTDQFLYFLGLAFVREQRRVVGLDQNGVAQADNGDGRAPVFGAGVENDIAGCVHVNEIGDGAVAFGIGLQVARQRGP